MRKLPPPYWLVATIVVVLLGLGLTQLGSRSTASDAPRTAAEPGIGQVAGFYYERLSQLERQLEGSPADAAERVEYARLLHDAHRHEEAAAELERYLAARPDERQAWLDLANVYGTIEDWDAAERVSRALLDRHPDDAAAIYNLGAIAANRGRYAESRSWWSRVVEDGEDGALAAQAVASLAELTRLEGGQRSSSALPPGHPPVGPVARYLPARPLSAQR